MSLIVIGTSPTTNEVLVKDTSTGDLSWKPGSKDQIDIATNIINSGDSYNQIYIDPNASAPTTQTKSIASGGTISAYQSINGQWYYNPDNTGGIANISNLPVNPSKVTLASSGSASAVPVKLQSYERTPGMFDIASFYDDSKDKNQAVTVLKEAGFSTSIINKVTAEATVRQIQFEKEKTAMAALENYKVGPDSFNINKFLLDHPGGKGLQILWDAGFSKEVVAQAAKENNEDAGLAAQEAAKPILSKLWQGMTPWDESKGETVSAGGVGIMAAEIIVPGVYTARHWEEMSGGERALSISLDVISLLPVAGSAARGAKSITVAGRATRIAGAAKGIGAEAIAQVRAPVDMLIHPIASVKGGYRNIVSTVENVVSPNKIPEAVITTANHTVKFKVTNATTPAQADAMRNKIMTRAMRGEKLIVEMDGQIIELKQSSFMKEVNKAGGALSHATPQGEVFLKGTTIKYKPGMAAKEQGLFLAHEPPTRFAAASAFNIAAKDKPSILIFSKETAAKSVSSHKIYNSPLGPVVEMERKFPVGFKTPAIKQKLFTRIGPEAQRVEIFLENPLSRVQKLKLKGMALIEDVKQPFEPAISIKGKGMVTGISDEAVDEIKSVLKASKNTDQARALERATRISHSQRSIPRSLESIIGNVKASEVRAERERLESAGTERVGTRSERTGEWDRTDVWDDRNVRDLTAEREELRPDRTRTDEKRREETRLEDRRDEPRPDDTRLDERRDNTRRDEDRPETRREEPRREAPRTDEPRRDQPRNDEPRRDEPRPDDTRLDERWDNTRRDEEERMDEGRERGGETPQYFRVRKTGRHIKGRMVTLGAPELPKEESRKFPKGTAAWKQGIGWWVWKSPYRDQDREFVLSKPQGAEISVDAKTAIGTVQSFGGTRAIDSGFDMGIVDVNLKNPPARPSRTAGRRALKFTRDPEDVFKGKQSRSKKVGPYYYRNGALSRKPIV